MHDLPIEIKQDTDELLKKILKKAILSQNGDVSRLMCRMGILNKLNYGVPVITLRQIAQQYIPNHALALKLWQKDIREAKILASMLTDVQLLTPTEIGNIVEMINNIEFAELFSRDILCYRYDIELLDILSHGNKWQIVTAIYNVGWAVKKNLPTKDDGIAFFMQNMNQLIAENYTEIRQPILFTMQAIGNVDDNYKDLMCQKARAFSMSDNIQTKRIGDEYQWLCEGEI